MKTFLLVLLAVFLLAACKKAQETTNPTVATDPGAASTSTSSNSSLPKRYLVESGIVEYDLSGPQTGTETVYFDKWGWREAKLTNTTLSMAGITRRENKLSVMDGDWLYTVDLSTRTGTKVQNTLLAQFVEAAKRKGQSMTDLGEELLTRMGGRKIGSEEIAGKSCDVWETKSLGSRSWIWRGVTLKTETSLGGMQLRSTARRFEENAAVPPDRFVIPTDVKITEGQDVKRVLEGIRERTKGR